MHDCVFLYMLGGICPHHKEGCNKHCENYATIDDESKPIFKDYNAGLNKLANELKHKYFKEDCKEEFKDFLK